MDAMISRGRVAVVLGRRGFSVVLLVFGAVVSIYMVLLAGPISAQDSDDGSGPPTGTPVNAQNTNNPSSPPNLFTIPVESCTVVDTGASVTLEESDGTQGRVVDGEGVEITATADQIRIEISNDGDQFGDVAEFTDSDNAFDTGNAITFVSSAGITCAGDGTGQNQNNDQNISTPELSTPAQNPSNQKARPRRNDVIRNTIPRRRLPPTGGLSTYAMVTGSILVGTCLLGLGLVVRRGSRD